MLGERRPTPEWLCDLATHEAGHAVIHELTGNRVAHVRLMRQTTRHQWRTGECLHGGCSPAGTMAGAVAEAIVWSRRAHIVEIDQAAWRLLKSTPRDYTALAALGLSDDDIRLVWLPVVRRRLLERWTAVETVAAKLLDRCGPSTTEALVSGDEVRATVGCDEQEVAHG